MRQRYGDGVGARFLDGVITQDLSVEREALLNHPLWTGLASGRTGREHLAVFAVQDAWLLQEIHRLDGLAIARAPNPEVADILLRKLTPKAGAMEAIAQFGGALGVPREAFAPVEPLAGCAALVSLFYYHLARSSFVEAAAVLGASETIFLEISARVEPDLVALAFPAPVVSFFAAHDALEDAEEAMSAWLCEAISTEAEADAVTRALRLLYTTERLFYDTVLAEGDRIRASARSQPAD